MSLFHPPSHFPPQLAFLWPIIWVQVLMLRAQIRAAYGRGVKYHWGVTPNLRVYLVSIDWMPSQKKTREWLAPSEHFNDRIAAACDGRAAAPAYLHLQPLSLGRGVGVRGKGVSASAARADMAYPLIPNPFSPGRRGLNLPLPET
ncbi:hypothetical protein [Hyphomonas jannaschiana]|uniref:Uncharacterized protein n=1 Tax=Hyphomonas jannaschiana VP2 TaxID=1280952 RepID=A0A059FBR0_9PROT|nr:hypothetical protein [Hyphomonas jannaschiana]KCZ88045.1 hypothetical protein HJA_10700 [Hyphomonas jannaschiana VP2]